METAETEENDMEEYSMFTMSLQDQEPYRVEIEFNGEWKKAWKLIMEQRLQLLVKTPLKK